MFGRQKVATLVAEFLGTGILTLVFLSVQRSSIGVPYFIAIAAGAAVAVATFYFANISGAQLNPAVTIALMSARRLSVLIGAVTVIAQMLGGWAAYGIYHYFVSSTLNSIGGHFSARVLLAEAVGALIIGLAYGAAYYRRLEGTNRALLVGGSYTLAIIVAAAVGIGIVNPAVAVGVRAFAFAGSMGWGTYLLGPILGAVIGLNLYWLLFSPSVEEELVGETVVAVETIVPTTSTSSRSNRSASAKSRKTTTAKKTPSKKKTTSSRKR